MKEKELIKLKDLIYIVIILIGVIVCLLTIRLGDNGTVVEYFGFAGTLISIILAVVALIYAFFQSITYGSANNKLEESAKKIEIVTEELRKFSNLEKVTKELANSIDEVKSNIYQATVGIHQVSASLQDNLSEMKTIVDTFDQNMNTIHSSVVETRQDILSRLSIGTEISEGALNVNKNEALEHIVSVLHKKQLMYLNYLVVAGKLGVNTNWGKYVEWALDNDYAFWNDIWNKEHEKDVKDRSTESIQIILQRNIGSFLAIQTIFTINGWIRMSGRLDNMKVEEVSEKLVSYLGKRNEKLEILGQLEELKELILKNSIEQD